MKKRSVIALVLAVLFLFSACGSANAPMDDKPTTETESIQPSESPTADAPAQPSFGGLEPSELFPEQEEEEEPTESADPAPTQSPSQEASPEETETTSKTEDRTACIYLEGDTASCTSDAVRIDGSTVTILDEGTYVLSGTLTNGTVIVNADKKDKTELVLNGATIHSESFAAIYVAQADKVTVTLKQGTENALSNGGAFEQLDDNNVDGVIFSKEDLVLGGSGALTVTAPGGHGIVSKDELIITGGTYEIASASHGMTGKDDLCIAAGTFSITAGKDGIRAEHDEDAECGFIQIEGGTFSIVAEGDGVSASSWLCINGGSFDIVTGGGSVNAARQTSDSWGGFGGMGGGPGGMGGGPGGMGGPGGSSGQAESTEEEDSTSIKGIKSGGDLTISGGSFVIDSADDAVHSNASLAVTGGSFEISTGDDGFHADAGLFIQDGVIAIAESYEGLEGLYIEMSGGTVDVTADDDGLNAAGGTDQSGFGGHRGGDMFAASDDSYITISGGTLSIRASGDGVDSNGALTISGGDVTICGPTNGDTAVLDYASTGTITGGTFIGTGAYMMAQTFSASEGQGVIAVSTGNQAAGTQITLTDKDGNVVLSHAPELSFAIVILSSPDIVKGETYTITVGSASGQFTAA